MSKILVVDDEVDILAEIEELLCDEGYEVKQAMSVDSALELLREHTDISLVITDLKMPGKSGKELICEAKVEFEREILFIIMSGHGSIVTDCNGLDISRRMFLKKPLDINQLVETVKYADSITA